MTKDKKFSILTQKDILILKKLLEDGRKSSAGISKEIDLGREIVNYRIKRLIKENLIVKFVPKINEDTIRYNEYVILLKLNLEDDISKKKFIKNTMGNKYLVWIVKSESGWDLIVRLYAQSLDEFKLKLKEILDGYSDVLAKYYTIIASDEIKESEKDVIAEQVFDEEISKKDFKYVKKRDVVSLDEKNREILNLLEEDGRIQYKHIAEKLDVSSDTVKYRIDKMKESGIIDSFIPIINYNKLGLIQYAAILKFMYLDDYSSKKVVEFLNSSKCVMRAIRNLNSEEYFLTLIFTLESEVDMFKVNVQNKFKGKYNSLELFKID
ncbi:MAG: winged helix-turn-helix transcriptional regulator [Nanoarchaeota archaeon]